MNIKEEINNILKTKENIQIVEKIKKDVTIDNMNDDYALYFRIEMVKIIHITVYSREPTQKEIIRTLQILYERLK